MHSKDDMRAFLLDYTREYPQLEIDDLIKLLYQSAFGCGHFAPSKAQVLACLAGEMESTQADAGQALTEPVPGDYARANIVPCAAMGLGQQTLARLFMLTADEAPQETAHDAFHAALELLEEMAGSGELPFSRDAMRARLNAYRTAGCPAVHHSEAYRAAYRPAYRILRRDYAQLLRVFARIDVLLRERARVIIAIDGSSGSGKSTLAALLEKVYEDAVLVHMDDFFLQRHQRTSERFAQPGGNVDHERFLDEVLAPMRRGEAFVYRPFDCARMEIGEGEMIAPGRLCIVEGSYSLHEHLEAAYDLKIVLTISPAAQAERIILRNGLQMFSRFMNEWIPMENLYFKATDIYERCDCVIRVTPQNGAAGYDVFPKEACR